ncbi:2Fe-2S iron-sulfur cluster-binding protein [Thermoproteota archaeon]
MVTQKPDSGSTTISLSTRVNHAKKEQPYYQDYEIPFSHGLTVLMALNYIYENIDSSIAYYYSCRTGKCGGCTVMINGKAVLACVTLVERDIVVEPLSGFCVTKDLVVNVVKSRATRH